MEGTYRGYLRRIVSGGQTGVDRAAWDAARSCGFPIGGWCPRGRRAEDGTIPSHYPCKETPSEVYEQRTAWNVRDSDGTLIVTCGEPRGGTAYTLEVAQQWKKPVLVLDLCRGGASLEQVHAWLQQHRIEVLNVAGPRESNVPGIYNRALAFLKQVFCALRHTSMASGCCKEEQDKEDESSYNGEHEGNPEL